MPQLRRSDTTRQPAAVRWLIMALCVVMLQPAELYAACRMPGMRQELRQEPQTPQEPQTQGQPAALPADSAAYLDADLLLREPADTAKTVVEDENSPYLLKGKRRFDPSPTRAVWLSALFPGLGQVYNRRYWKLPIVVGGFMGLAYGTSWNNGQLRDYTQAYRDLTDNDPNTKSYMNFFPPTTSEDQLDKTWLTNTMRSRRDYYRRNRDLCIICLVGLYLLCMVDAYVDASLAHFDVSEDVSMDVAPAVLPTPGGPTRPAFGMQWAFTF